MSSAGRKPGPSTSSEDVLSPLAMQLSSTAAGKNVKKANLYAWLKIPPLPEVTE